MQIGLLADLHGDLAGFQAALKVFEREHVERILCAGDIVERGSDAEEIVRLMRVLDIACIKGNHEYSVIANQNRWRQTGNPERMAQIGRVISDETAAYLESLPASARYEFEKTRLLMGHGTPWSDVLTVFPDSRQGIFDQLWQRYGSSTDVMILGHTHQPMCVTLKGMLILNPGSVYGVMIRDSHTCGVLSLPGKQVQVYDLNTGSPIELATADRSG